MREMRIRVDPSLRVSREVRSGRDPVLEQAEETEDGRGEVITPAPVQPGLIRYDAMRSAIRAAHSVDEAKDIKDKAQALLAYALQRKDPEVARGLAEIKLRARRRIGEISETMDKSAGGKNP